MQLEDYGIWVQIRNKEYPIDKGFTDTIAEAIENDLKEEDLDNLSTFRYDLYHNGQKLGSLISYKKDEDRKVSTHLESSLWIGKFNKTQRHAIAEQLSYVEYGLQKALKRLTT